MPYTINGKVYSSHALMDEIVYHTKLILKGLILKNEKIANENETEDSLLQSDYFLACKNGSMDLSFFPMTKEMLMEYGCEGVQASQWVADYTEIPEDEREAVLDFCVKYFLEHYEEQNNYYRKLAGMPEYSLTYPDDYAVKLSWYNYVDDEGVIRNEFDDRLALDDFNSDFNLDVPIYKYSLNQINTLESLGIMDIIREREIKNKTETSYKTIHMGGNNVRYIEDTAEHYLYLNFLGSKSIDIYTARIADNWDIIWMPRVEYLVESRFKELFALNREDIDRRVNQLAYSVESDYFDEMVMLMIITQTFADMITDTPEWYIRRDVFDLRTVKYFLDSQGVKFFIDIPLRYQIRIVKGLNKLIRYKSTNKNIDDILEIFNVTDVTVYKYYLFKKYLYTDLSIKNNDKLDPEWKMDDIYDFGDLDTDNDFEDEDYLLDFFDIDDDIQYGEEGEGVLRLYEFESEDPEESGAYDEFVEPDGQDLIYDFYNEEMHPDEVHHTARNGIDILDGNELYDYGFLDSSVIEDYDELEIIHDYGNEDAEYVVETEVTNKIINYKEKRRRLKDAWNNVYDLEFVKTPIGETYDDYIKDAIYREDYDTVTNQDKYWDGEDVHYYVKNNHYMKDFTIEGTKYMALEYNVSIDAYNYQKEYYLGLLFNGSIDMEDIHIAVPSIADKEFTLINLVIFIYCCNGIYLDRELHIKDLSKAITDRTKPKPDFEPYADVDGGRPWTNGSSYVPPEEEPEPEEDFDFGNLDVEDYDDGSVAIIYDYGYHIDIDYQNPNLIIHDFGVISDSSIDNETERNEELADYLQGMRYCNADFGDETGDVPRNQYTVNFDFGLITDRTRETLPDDIYDYGLITDTSDDAIILDDDWEMPEEPVPTYNYGYDTIVYVEYDRPYYYCGMVYINQSTGETVVLTKKYIDEHWDEIVGRDITIRFYWNTLKPEEYGIYEEDLDCRHPGDFNDVDYYLDIDGGYEPFSGRITRASFYDYINTEHPYTMVDANGRIYGFNMGINLDELSENMGFRHSHFGFDRGYTLADCGCETFIAKKEFDTLEELYRVYDNNTKCYNNLVNLMINATTRDEKRVYDYVFNQLFTIPWDSSFYILRNGDMATTYDQILQERDYTLYNVYKSLKNEPDTEIRKYNIRNILNDLVDTLSYYIQGDNLKYALTFIATNSFDAMVHYISEMVDFFKSWKVYFLNPRIVYHVDDKQNHKVGYEDQIEEIKIKYWTPGNIKMTDSLDIKILYYPIIPQFDPLLNKGAEVMDIANHYVEHDPLLDKDFDGLYVEDITDQEPYELDGGGVHELTHQQEWYAEQNNISVQNERCWPYYNMDGREISAGKDLYELDGGGPKPVDYYLNADGLAVNDPCVYTPRKTFETIDIEYFYIIDAGEVLDHVDIFELDGGYADTLEEEYVYDIDAMRVEGLYTFKPFSRFDLADDGNYYIEGKRIQLGSEKIVRSVQSTGDESYFIIEGGRPNIHHIEDPSTIIDIDEYNQVAVDVRISKSKYNGLKVVENDETADAPMWPLRSMDFGDIANQTLVKGKLVNPEIVDFGSEEDDGLEYADPSAGQLWDFDFGYIEWDSIDYVEPDELLEGSGLYFDHGTFAKADEIEEQYESATIYELNTTNKLYRYRDTIIQYSDIYKVEQEINNIYNTLFANFKKVNRYMNNSNLERNARQVVNDKIQGFNDWFSDYNPYNWTELQEEEDVVNNG